MSIDVAALAAILREAAKAEIMPRFRRLEAGSVRVKSIAVDLVTDADVAAEARIRDSLALVAPDALFVGEESVAANPALLDELDTAALAIVVDPIDGTGNYAAGLPLFATMAAVVVAGETVAGVIYDPLSDDWVMAEKGAGAFARRADGAETRLQVADPVPLSEMNGTASASWFPEDVRSRVLANLAKVRLFAAYRCAGHEYRILAAGHTHFAQYRKLLPWDHLAGALISQEAGAHVARFDASAYLPQHRDGGLLIATDPDSWAALRNEVFTV